MSFSISNISRDTVLPAVARKIANRLNTHIYNCSYVDPRTGKPNKYFHTHEQVRSYTTGLNIAPVVLYDHMREGEQYLFIPSEGRESLFPDGLIQEFKPKQLHNIRKHNGRTFHPSTKESFSPISNGSHIRGKNCFILDFENDDSSIQLFSQDVFLENCTNVVVIGGRDITVKNCSGLIIVDCENFSIENQNTGFFQENNLTTETQIELPEDMYANFDFEISTTLEELLAKKIGVEQSNLNKLFDQLMRDDPALLDRLIYEGGADLDLNELIKKAQAVLKKRKNLTKS